VLPVVLSTFKVVDNKTFKTFEDQLDLSKEIINMVSGEECAIKEFVGETDTNRLELGVAIRAENASIRKLHALLKTKAPSFGGLVRVLNKHDEFYGFIPNLEVNIDQLIG
jgi:hypothetical protein